MDSRKYTVHLLLLGSMRPLKHTTDEERKRGKGFVAVLQKANLHWWGRKEGRLEITKLQKGNISLFSPELLEVHLPTLRGPAASILLNTLPQSQEPKEPFASLPWAWRKGITFWWREKIGRAKLADQNKRQGIISLKIIPCILLNNLTNKMAKHNLFYSAHRLGTPSSPGHTHYSNYVDQHHPCYCNILKVWCSVIAVEQIC